MGNKAYVLVSIDKLIKTADNNGFLSKNLTVNNKNVINNKFEYSTAGMEK